MSNEMKGEFDGEKYKHASSQQHEWGVQLIGELDLKGSERILDLGCGHGALTAELAALVPAGSVLGIDMSESMIVTATTDHIHANLQFEIHDINDIDFESQFDIVFSNATLHWIKNHRTLLQKVRKCLKPGGRLRCQFAGHGNCSNLIASLCQVMASERWMPYFTESEWPWYMPTIDQYRVLLGDVQFTESNVWCQNGDKYFETLDKMVAWIDQPCLVPFLASVDERDRKPFRDEVINQMIKKTRRADGTFYETFRRLNVLARR